MLRHKVQAVAIGLVVLVSTASATLGLALLARHQPTALSSMRSARRTARIGCTVNTAGAAELAATRHLGGVTAAAGPFSS